MKYQLITIKNKARENKGIFSDILISPNKITFKGKTDIVIPQIDVLLVNNLAIFEMDYSKLKETIENHKNYTFKVYLEKRFKNTYIVNLITDYEIGLD